MASPTVTYSFTNGNTIDAGEHNTNNNDLINAMTDGTADFNIGSLVVAGSTTINGAVTLGNATSDDLTLNGSVATNLNFKTNAAHNIGSSTLAPLSLYLGNGTKSTRILAGTIGTSYSITLPNDVSLLGQTMVGNASGVFDFRYYDKFVSSKTGTYTATADEVCIPVAPSASFDLTLPSATNLNGKTFKIIKTDSDFTKVVTIKDASAATVTTLNTQGECVHLSTNGTSWFVINRYIPKIINSVSGITIGATTTAPTKPSGIATDVLYWERDGAYLIGRIEYAQTNTTGAAAGSGDYLFTAVPTGLTIDTTKVTVYTTVEGSGVYNTTNAVGHAHARGSTVPSTGLAVVYDTTQIRMFLVSSGTGGAVSAAAHAINDSANQYYCAVYRVPITGWNG